MERSYHRACAFSSAFYLLTNNPPSRTIHPDHTLGSYINQSRTSLVVANQPGARRVHRSQVLFAFLARSASVPTMCVALDERAPFIPLVLSMFAIGASAQAGGHIADASIGMPGQCPGDAEFVWRFWISSRTLCYGGRRNAGGVVHDDPKCAWALVRAPLCRLLPSADAKQVEVEVKALPSSGPPCITGTRTSSSADVRAGAALLLSEYMLAEHRSVHVHILNILYVCG
jgi:hypothetical protein